MPSRRLRLIAILAVLLHGATSLISLGHRHDDHAQAKTAAGKRFACCHHHCSHAEQRSSSSQTVPKRDHTDCAACRHLAQPLLHVVVELDLSAGQFFVAAPRLDLSWPLLPPRRCYLSRGPPGLSV